MIRRILRLALVSAAISSGRLNADDAPPPLVLDDATGRWKLSAVHRPVAPGINLEMVASLPGTKERLVVLSSDLPNDTSESLNAFSHQLYQSFTAMPAEEASGQDADEMGFTGRVLHFELHNDEPVQCRLFVFTYTGRPWAVLHIHPLDTASQLPNAFSVLRKRGRSDGVVDLERYKVRGVPLTSFPISFQILRNRTTNRVSKIVVTDVPEGSETQQAGVEVGDWVTRINGREVGQFAGGVDIRSEIGRIFLDRPFGEKLELDLVAAATQKPYGLTLTSRGRSMIDRIR